MVPGWLQDLFSMMAEAARQLDAFGAKAHPLLGVALILSALLASVDEDIRKLSVPLFIGGIVFLATRSLVACLTAASVLAAILAPSLTTMLLAAAFVLMYFGGAG